MKIYSLYNVRRLTLLSYLMFGLLGILFISQGVLIIYISQTYDFSLAYTGYLFFIPATVQAVTTFFNGYIIEKVNLKLESYVGFGAIIFSLITLISGWKALFIIGLFPAGLGYGLLISVGNYMILKLHPMDKFSKLNILNFAFSVGGILGPAILGQLLNLNVPWQVAVSIAVLLVLLIYFFMRKIKFSNFKPEHENKSSKKDSILEWNLSIYLISASLLFYVISECTFSTWIVSYFKMNYSFSISEASMGLTIYWFFIAFGRFGANRIGNIIKVHHFILYSVAITFIANLLVLLVSNTVIDFVMIALMGLCTGSLFASIFSYGMDQLPGCPRLMSFLALCGTIGAILAMPVSSYFVRAFSITAALYFGLVMMGVVAGFIYLTMHDRKNVVVDYREQFLLSVVTVPTRLLMYGVKYIKNAIE